MTYRFGDFTLDPDTRQLLRNSDEIHLSPKAFDLLTLLVVNRARAVSKAELQRHLWPSTFVEETNLATLVAQIRRALRGSASSPGLVRSVYGFGYRFVTDVIVNEGASRTEPSRPRLWLTFERRQIPLMEGANVIGRAADAAIQIDAPGVSRHHARVVIARGVATLEDLGSKNGTRVNGSRVTAPCRLVDGSEIRLGPTALTFRVGSPDSPTATINDRDSAAR